MRLYLREDFEANLAALAPGLARAPNRRDRQAGATLAQAIYDALAKADGTVYRQAARRRTIRLAATGGVYFAKLHHGVGWREIAKNLFVWKRPVLGARNEFVACLRLCGRGVHAPAVAAFGECGRNPARQRSFLVCNAVEGFASLEELLGSGACAPPLRRRIVAAAGALLRSIHTAGVHHRDCYTAHILANTAELAAGRVDLAVIDLHRARVRERLPKRWRCRDLAALLFSAGAFRPTRQDLVRFAAAYAGGRKTWRRDARFWRGVLRRARRLQRRAARRGRPAAAGAGLRGDRVPSVTDFRDLPDQPRLPFRVDVDFEGGATRVRCVAMLCWRPKRGFTAQADVNGDAHLLSAFFGFARARRFRRAKRVARCLVSAGVGPELIATGRSGGVPMLLWRMPAGRPPAARELPTLLAALARLHEQTLRPVDLPQAQFWLRGQRVCIAPWQVGPLRTPRRPAIEHDIALLLARFADGTPLAAALRHYARARRWSTGRLRAARVRRHMAKLARDRICR